MKKQFILLALCAIFLIACRHINKLSEDDYLWMPYNGDETLVFKSNTGNVDSIFILKKDTLIAYPEAQALNGTKYEIVSVFCNHHSRDEQDSGRSHYFFQIQKAKDSRAALDFDLSANGAVFYRLSSVKIDSLNNVKPETLQILSGKYNDVYIIYPDDYAKDFSNRSNFVTKLYWSKSKGLIRYDKKDGIYWELIELYDK